MRPILSEILTFGQHLNTLKESPDLYRPKFCPYCHAVVIWCHGFYYRKPDRINHGNDSVNDIPIPRHQCADCRHTFSTLPECIAPRRWYPWAIQQWCLWLSLNGWSVRQIHQCFPISRSTIKRWINWLLDYFALHHHEICNQLPEMGYFANCAPFWNHWLKSRLFSHAMVLLNKGGLVVP